MKDLIIIVTVTLYAMTLTSLMAYTLSPLPTSSEPTRPPLEVIKADPTKLHKTHNPQLTVDGKTLQGSEL